MLLFHKTPPSPPGLATTASRSPAGRGGRLSSRSAHPGQPTVLGLDEGLHLHPRGGNGSPGWGDAQAPADQGDDQNGLRQHRGGHPV